VRTADRDREAGYLVELPKVNHNQNAYEKSDR
jgi:hypothetical protein